MLVQDILALSVLIVASVTDLHKRVVPTWIYAGGFLAGAVLAVVNAIGLASWFVLLDWICGVGLMTLVGWLLWKAKDWFGSGWGGGDTKLLIAVGSILGFTASISYLTSMSIVGIVYAALCVIWKKFINPSVSKEQTTFPFVPAMALAEVLRRYV